MVLRDLTPEKARAAKIALEELPRDGLPNYFDDQRFGSVGYDGDFIGRAWLVGDHEKALRLAIAEANPSDRPDARDEKAILRETWGNWAEAKAQLPRSHARSLVTYLVDHPTDFRGAFARVRRELTLALLLGLPESSLEPRTGPVDRAERRVPTRGRCVEFKVASLAHPSRASTPIRPRCLTAAQTPTSRVPRTPLPAEAGPVRDAVLEVVAGFGLKPGRT